MELSVIIPVYNCAKTLEATLDSVLAQGKLPFDWEVVAVDDGSKDNSLAILHRYEKRATEAGIRMRVLPFENGGVGVCRNRGLQAATGDAILYLDADDRLDPGALLFLMKKKKEKKAAILVFDSRYLYCDGSTAPFSSAEHPGGEMSVEEYMLSQPCPWNKICDRSLFTESGLRFEEGILYEDLAVIPALGSRARGRIWYEKASLHSYYQSENSIMRSPWSEKRLDIFLALKALKRNVQGEERALEYLFWLHLYRHHAWLFWEEGRPDAIRLGNALMKQSFPHWKKNPLIRKRASCKERLTAALFYGEHFKLLSLWKGGKE